MDPQWLAWVKRLQAIAQNGLTYCTDPYDRERYEALRELAAEMASAGADLGIERVRDLFGHEAGHVTPKVDVRAAVFRDDAILLVRERAEGRWTLPGGWADVGEAPGEAIVREVYEESGYRTRAVKLLALYDRDKHDHPPLAYHVYKLFFLCELLDDERIAPAWPDDGDNGPHSAQAMHNIETDAVGFFREDALPELSLTRVTPAQIAHLFAHHRHPDWPTDFD